MSLALATIILGTVALTLVSASRSLEMGRDDNASRSAATGALGELLDELRTADSVVERTGTTIALRVPDRSGDGSPDTVRYTWDDKTGLAQRRVNDGQWRPLNIRGVTPEPIMLTQAPPSIVLRTNVALASHTSTSGGTSSEIRLGPEGHVAQYVLPTMSQSGLRWRPTRLRLSTRRTAIGVNSALLVAVVRAGPVHGSGDQVVGYATLSSVDVGWTFGWITLNLESTDWVPAGEGVVIRIWSVETTLLSVHLGDGSLINVAEPTSSISSSGRIFLEFEAGGNTHPGMAMLRSVSGRGWALQDPGTDLMFQLHGSVEEVSP